MEGSGVALGVRARAVERAAGASTTEEVGVERVAAAVGA